MEHCKTCHQDYVGIHHCQGATGKTWCEVWRCSNEYKTNHSPSQEPTASLRDQFAMAALTGIYTNNSYYLDNPDLAAKYAFAIADQALAARVQGKE